MNWSDVEAWVVTDGKPGMENQCLGLAEAVGARTSVKRIKVATPWRWLSPWPVLAPLSAVDPPLGLPWPQLLIASGRQSIGPALRVKAAANCFTVQIQDPVAARDRFDLIVPPRHDKLSGPNVLPTRGALHRVTPARLQAEAEIWRASLAHLPRPLVAVLIGGANSAYRLGPAEMTSLAAQLRGLGAGLAITPSRRTDPKAVEALKQGLEGAAAMIWDGTSENPYFGYLGLADHVLVTCDSVSMTSEALATTKPVHVIQLPGGNAKFTAFHAGLMADGLTRPFDGRLESWTYVPPDDTGMVAAEIRRRMER
jgi:uncharacterized protein